MSYPISTMQLRNKVVQGDMKAKDALAKLEKLDATNTQTYRRIQRYAAKPK